MFPPLAITQYVNLRKTATLKVTANFKYRGRDVTTFGHVLTKTRPTKSPLSSPAPTPRASTSSGPCMPSARLASMASLSSSAGDSTCCDGTADPPPPCPPKAASLIGGNGLLRGGHALPDGSGSTQLPFTAKKGLISSHLYCLQVEVFTDRAISL